MPERKRPPCTIPRYWRRGVNDCGCLPRFHFGPHWLHMDYLHWQRSQKHREAMMASYARGETWLGGPTWLALWALAQSEAERMRERAQGMREWHTIVLITEYH